MSHKKLITMKDNHVIYQSEGPLHECGQPTVRKHILKKQTYVDCDIGNYPNAQTERIAHNDNLHSVKCAPSCDLFKRFSLDNMFILFGLFYIILATQYDVTDGTPLKEYKSRAKRGVPDDIYYLGLFGYLPQSSIENGGALQSVDTRGALLEYQRFTNLPQTGEYDDATQRMMHSPRCGLPDINDGPRISSNTRSQSYYSVTIDHTGPYRRTKRSTETLFRWSKNDLTYRILNFTPDLPPHETRSIIRLAFSHWARYVPLSFTELDNGNADIDIIFRAGYHGDGSPFQGEGNVLAHAYFPGDHRLSGDLHFDEDETWTIQSSHGTDLLFVATHELGHSLGLTHSNDRKAVMFPYYPGYKSDFQLRSNDIFRIQELYGAKPASQTERPTYTYRPRPKPTHRPTRPPYRPTRPPPTRLPSYEVDDVKLHPGDPIPCTWTVDAVADIRGEIMIFSGKYFWRFHEKKVTPGSPILITTFWVGLPKDITHVDAVYERYIDSRIVFFIGNRYWIFEHNNDQSFRRSGRSITDFGLDSGIERVDGAFVWGYNRKTYFFTEDLYWRYDDKTRRIDGRYPQNMFRVWKKVPTPINDVFIYEGNTHFVKGVLDFEFDDIRMNAKDDPSYFVNKWTGNKCRYSNDLLVFDPDNPETGNTAQRQRLNSYIISVCTFLAFLIYKYIF